MRCTRASLWLDASARRLPKILLPKVVHVAPRLTSKREAGLWIPGAQRGTGSAGIQPVAGMAC